MEASKSHSVFKDHYEPPPSFAKEEYYYRDYKFLFSCCSIHHCTRFHCASSKTYS